MSDQLGSIEAAMLDQHSAALLDRQRHDEITAIRATNAAQTLILAANQAVVHNIAATPSHNGDGERMPARTYMAAILSLIGEKDPSMSPGHMGTPQVVLGRDVEQGGVKYSEVSVALEDVDTVHTVLNREDYPRVTLPEELLEGSARLYARQGDERPEPAGRVSAWIGVDARPSHLMRREDHVKPTKLVRVAQSMLEAMADPTLNPDLFTLRFVSSMSSELGEAVENHSVPMKDIKSDPLLLPAWLQTVPPVLNAPN
jgi:hypothetical protein